MLIFIMKYMIFCQKENDHFLICDQCPPVYYGIQQQECLLFIVFPDTLTFSTSETTVLISAFNQLVVLCKNTLTIQSTRRKLRFWKEKIMFMCSTKKQILVISYKPSQTHQQQAPMLWMLVSSAFQHLRKLIITAGFEGLMFCISLKVFIRGMSICVNCS